MNASIQGALNNLGNSWRAFEHNGHRMSYNEVKAVLEYGLAKGYKTTNELTDAEIDNIITNLKSREGGIS